jgi:hypothetical protein
MMDCTQFQIEQHYLFTPDTEQVFARPFSIHFGKEKVLKYKNNPTAKQKKEGYWPRLTLNVSPSKEGGGLDNKLRVEFSAPKMLFGNNFDELLDNQFGDLVRTLADKMRLMGVRVMPETLAQAQVSSIHYSKNVILTDYTRCSMVLQELAKLNVWKRLDLNTKDFRDGGHVLKWHANSFEICVYDKVQDLQKGRISPKRAFENDPECQLELFADLQAKQTQALRLEVRLNNRRKIRSVLKALEEEDDVSFHMLFQKRLAAKVLAYYWAELMAQQSMGTILEADLRNPDQFVEAIMAENPDMTASKVLQTLGATLLMQNKGEPAFKVLMGKYNPKTTTRLIKDCKEYQPKVAPRWVAVQQVKQALEEFQPVRLENMVQLTQGTR